MDGVAISIIGRPRPLPGPDTPNPAHNTYTLNCEEPDKPLDDPGQFVLPSVEEAFPGMHVTISDNTKPDLHPVPTLTPGAHVTPQSGAQSGAQSGE